ncbi:MAG TPA: hypothetical protein VIK89_01950 [Cytophagaceae bacterium]
MLELFTESLRAPNLPATVLLSIVLIYWLISMLGFFDLDMFDAEVEADADAPDGVGGGNGALHAISEFFLLGDIPITILISFFALFFWMGTVLTNYYLGNTSMIFALLIYIPCLIVALLLTKIVVTPLAKLYKQLNKDEEHLPSDFSGSVGMVAIDTTHELMGQAEINRNGDCIRVNIKTTPGKSISKGQSALLIEYYPDKGYYLAEPYETLK